MNDRSRLGRLLLWRSPPVMIGSNLPPQECFRRLSAGLDNAPVPQGLDHVGGKVRDEQVAVWTRSSVATIRIVLRITLHCGSDCTVARCVAGVLEMVEVAIAAWPVCLCLFGLALLWPYPTWLGHDRSEARLMLGLATFAGGMVIAGLAARRAMAGRQEDFLIEFVRQKLNGSILKNEDDPVCEEPPNWPSAPQSDPELPETRTAGNAALLPTQGRPLP